jgi:hypothetical protein
VKPIKNHYFVIIEGEVSEVGKFLETFYSLDSVEREIKPLEIDQMIYVLYFFDYVVIKLQLLQSVKSVEVLYFKDI